MYILYYIYRSMKAMRAKGFGQLVIRRLKNSFTDPIKSPKRLDIILYYVDMKK